MFKADTRLRQSNDRVGEVVSHVADALGQVGRNSELDQVGMRLRLLETRLRSSLGRTREEWEELTSQAQSIELFCEKLPGQDFPQAARRQLLDKITAAENEIKKGFSLVKPKNLAFAAGDRKAGVQALQATLANARQEVINHQHPALALEQRARALSSQFTIRANETRRESVQEILKRASVQSPAVSRFSSVGGATSPTGTIESLASMGFANPFRISQSLPPESQLAQLAQHVNTMRRSVRDSEKQVEEFVRYEGRVMDQHTRDRLDSDLTILDGLLQEQKRVQTLPLGSASKRDARELAREISRLKAEIGDLKGIYDDQQVETRRAGAKQSAAQTAQRLRDRPQTRVGAGLGFRVGDLFIVTRSGLWLIAVAASSRSV
jgi:hypothetical protein